MLNISQIEFSVSLYCVKVHLSELRVSRADRTL
jgi:hypothetical protein